MFESEHFFESEQFILNIFYFHFFKLIFLNLNNFQL
jgi:hypothetical protein